MRPIAETVGHHVFGTDVYPSDDLYPSDGLVPGGETDAHGNLVHGWAPAVEVGVYAFNPGATAETHDPGRSPVSDSPTVYLPPGVVFGSRDHVTARGVLYEVEGETRKWVHPTDSTRSANVATLKAVAG